MADQQQAEISHSKHEWARTLIPKISFEKERISAQTCRKRSTSTVTAENGKVAAKEAKRQEKRVECLAKVSVIPDPVTKTLTVVESDNDDSEYK